MTPRKLFVAVLIAVATAVLGAPAAAQAGTPAGAAVYAGTTNVGYFGPTLPVVDALNNVAAQVTAVWQYDASAAATNGPPWRFWSANPAVPSTLNELAHGQAYFVISDAAARWEFVSADLPEPDTSLRLTVGLNNIAYAGPTLPVSEALGGAAIEVSGVSGDASCSASVTSIFSLEADGGYSSWIAELPEDLQSLRQLEEGGAYWLLSEATGECVIARDPAPPLVFTDVTEEAGLIYIQHALSAAGSCLFNNGAFCEPERITGGTAVADYDRDGWPDVYVTRLDNHDILYRNRGDGSFEDVTATTGLADLQLRSNGAGWADIDNDGDPDLYVTTLVDLRFYLFINDGEGHFSEEGVERGAAIQTEDPHLGMSVAFGDYNRDGWIDIQTTEWKPQTVSTEPSHGRLLRNRGAEAPGFFDDVTAAAGVVLDEIASQAGFDRHTGSYSFAPAFVDLDGDGWQEIAIASDFGKTRLFWNNGDGSFTDGTVAAAVGTDQNGMGSAFGDYDGDGDLDWFVTSIFDANETCDTRNCNWGYTGNRLYRNDGARSFADATDAAGVRDGGWGWGTVFFDYDNDGDLDLTMTNGFAIPAFSIPYETDPMRLWENDAGTFTERSAEVGITDTGQGKGLVTFDYDRDGDLDLLVINNHSMPRLYRNDGHNANGWLQVRLVGTTSNRDGLGARVTVTPTAGATPQLREIGVRSHFLGQSERVEHFGLGAQADAATQRVAEVRVEWPASGIVTVLQDVPANVRIVVQEGEDTFTIDGA